MREQKTLAHLTAQAQYQERLLARLRAELPEPLASHCIGAALKGSTLSLLVDSPVWNARLRFQSPQLLSQLRGDFPGLANIQVTVARPAQTRPKPSRHRPRMRSTQAASIVEQASSGISDPALSEALQRLAKVLKVD